MTDTTSLPASLEFVSGFLERGRAAVPADVDVAHFRRALDENRSAFLSHLPMRSITEETVPDGPVVRIYRPLDEGGAPAVLYFHGGAYLRGNLDVADTVCREISSRASCVVVSVDYRLAPEHRYPAALDDADCAAEWLLENAARLGVPVGRMIVAGDSAGASIATVLARRKPSRVALQILLCGMYSFEEPICQVGRASLLVDRVAEQARLDWVAEHYLPTRGSAREGEVAEANPLDFVDFVGQPEALIVTSELDPFALQTREYARKLSAAGVGVSYLELAGLPHAFTNFSTVFAEATIVFDLAAAAVRRVPSE